MFLYIFGCILLNVKRVGLFTEPLPVLAARNYVITILITGECLVAINAYVSLDMREIGARRT